MLRMTDGVVLKARVHEARYGGDGRVKLTMMTAAPLLCYLVCV